MGLPPIKTADYGDKKALTGVDVKMTPGEPPRIADTVGGRPRVNQPAPQGQPDVDPAHQQLMLSSVKAQKAAQGWARVLNNPEAGPAVKEWAQKVLDWYEVTYGTGRDGTPFFRSARGQ